MCDQYALYNVKLPHPPCTQKWQSGLGRSEKATESKVTGLILRLEYMVAFYYSSSKEIPSIS